MHVSNHMQCLYILLLRVDHSFTLNQIGSPPFVLLEFRNENLFSATAAV